MRRLCPLLFLFAIAMLLAMPASVQAQVEHTTSDITGAERVSSTSLQDTEIVNYAGSDIAYKAEYTFQPEDAVATWKLDFYGFATEPTDLAEAQRVLIWINGQRHNIDDTEARTQRLDGEVLEIQSATLSAAVFQRIADADAVEVTIGAAEFDVPYADRADMREIVDRAQSIQNLVSPQQRADNGGR